MPHGSEISSLNCEHCNHMLEPLDKFCSHCGRKTDKSTQHSDFEVGKLAALDTIKSDFLKWVGGISLIITILGLFGFTKLVEGTVSERVTAAISKIREDVDHFSKDTAVQLGITKADLDRRSTEFKKREEELGDLIRSGKQAEAQLTELRQQLDQRSHELSQSAQALNAQLAISMTQGSQLSSSLTELSKQKDQLDRETDALVQKKNQISAIIENTNFVLVFNKLKLDLFRIKDIAVTADIIFKPVTTKSRELLISSGAFDIYRRSLAFQVSFSSKDGVMTNEGKIGGELLGFGQNAIGYMGEGLIKEAIPPSKLGTKDEADSIGYSPPIFGQSLELLRNRPIEVLAQMDELTVTFSSLSKSIDPRFEEILNAVRQIEITLFVNSVPTSKFVLGPLKREDVWNVPSFKTKMAIGPLINQVRELYEQNIVPIGADIETSKSEAPPIEK